MIAERRYTPANPPGRTPVAPAPVRTQTPPRDWRATLDVRRGAPAAMYALLGTLAVLFGALVGAWLTGDMP